MDKLNPDILVRLKAAEMILLAGSAGSFNPIYNIVKSLPENFKKTITIIIHRGRNNFTEIEKLFGDNSRISVAEIGDKDKIEPGNVYIAPANYHTLIELGKTFALDVSDAVWYSKPAIDVTFQSAADVYGKKCAAILFSGANQDGAEGLLRLKHKGALTIVQHPQDADMYVMPQAAIDIGAAEFVLSTQQILDLLQSNL